MIASPIGLARIDGVSADVRIQSTTLSLRTGIRPDDGFARIDDASYLPDTERETRNEFADHTSLVEAALRLVDTHGDARLAVRRESTIDGDFRDGTRLGLALRAGGLSTSHAGARLRMHADTGALERYDVNAIARLPSTSIQLATRGSVAVFPLDSVFSVFPRTRYDEQLLRLRFGQQIQIETTALARSSGAEHARTRDRLRTAGGSISLSERRPDGTQWRASVQYARGSRGSELRAFGSVTVTPQRGPGWRASYVISRRVDEVTGAERERLGAFARIRAHWRIDDWSELSLATDVGWSERNQTSVRVFATADISLPGGPS